MEKYVVEKEVEGCYHECMFFGTSSDGMECTHPYFEDKEPYDNMIITQDNSRGKIPEKCPLRISGLEFTYRIKLKTT